VARWALCVYVALDLDDFGPARPHKGLEIVRTWDNRKFEGIDLACCIELLAVALNGPRAKQPEPEQLPFALAESSATTWMHPSPD
jgi:hypothetical protein